MPKRNPKPETTDRKIVYAKLWEKRYGRGNNPMSSTVAKEFLGWTEETTEKFGSDFLLRDHHGTKIRCENNLRNRPLYNATIRRLQQEHLNCQWQYNGEPIIIGETGLLLNGQHSLVSLILACQEWKEDNEKWLGNWPEEPTMEKLAVFGVSETDKVVNTMDTCKPRSLSDVLYRSSYFQELQSKDRAKVSKITENAIRLLWHRTGACLNAFAPRRTFSESLDFLDRHPKLLDCVRHIYEEDSDEKRISNSYTPPGYAAGLLYLMACSNTDPTEYRETRNEESLDLNCYEKACDFWVLLAGDAPEISVIKKVLSKMQNENWASRENRWSVLIKAWNLYSSGKEITATDLKLKHTTDDEGSRTVTELPIVDGIDIGSPSEIDEGHVAAKDPTPEEIEARSTAERKRREKKANREKTDTPKPENKTAKKKTARKPKVGQVWWVADKEPWKGKITELSVDKAELTILQGFAGASGVAVASLESLSRMQPKPTEG